ncbi:hypothetical protein [uncultured Acinetobacter sp.]|uniref:hypothetical protein n=1 Tax=uncultured Acinetobacter sp. TaxID=165433 RepID=UPI00258CA393|nr:hypothetical protein [uncultured Acinetobacter sp.]
MMIRQDIFKLSIYSCISIIISSLVICQLLKVYYARYPQTLDFIIQVNSYKNDYTQNDFIKELDGLNSSAYAIYESNYFIPFITTHLQRETILMLPILRKNTDIELSPMTKISNNQFSFKLPLYSQRNVYPLSHIDLNFPSVSGGISLNCKSKSPLKIILIDTENYTAQIIFNKKICSIYSYS